MKKSITLLLTLVMLLTTVVTASAATPVLTDVAGEKCEAAVNVLAGLGIVEGRSEGKYEPNGSLTRAEMATIILRAMNMEEGAQGQAIFEDVPASHWAYANVAAAYQLGIINGMSATIFSPDTAVTDEQAIKMVVAALGYGVQAEAAGGYPSGYLAKASQLDILKNIKVEGEMNRGDMAILLYNALNTKLSIQSSYGDVKLEFEEDDDVTLLTYYLKAQCYTDVVGATPMGVAYAAAPSVKNNEIALGTTAATSVVMTVGETNAQEFLGQRVDVYAREDELTGKPAILAIVPRATTEVVDVNIKDIEASDVSYAAGVFAYENENGKIVEEDIARAVVIKNGRVIAAPTDADITPAIGSVRLIRNSGKTFQYIIVEEYVNRLVKSVNTKTNRVVFMDGSGMTLDLESKTQAVSIVDAEGKALTLDDLAEWDVLSIAESTSVIRVRVSNETVEGAVTETRAGYATIGEKEYPVAATLLSGAISATTEGTFYLDCTGTIVAVESTSGDVTFGGADIGDLTYGWLRDITPEVKGSKTTYYVEIFTSDGEWETFNFAEKVKFNGGAAQDAELLMDETRAETDLWGIGNAPTLVNRRGDVVPQLIVYKEGKEGIITEVMTAENLTSKDLSIETRTSNDSFSMDWYINHAFTLKSDGTGNRSGNVVTFNGEPAGVSGTSAGTTEYAKGVIFGLVSVGEASAFIIPEDLADDESYEVTTAGGMLGSIEVARTRGCVSFYDVDEDYNAGVLVWRKDLMTAGRGGSTTEVPASAGATSIVTAIATSLDEDGEVQTVIKVQTPSGTKDVVVTERSQLFYHGANADALADPDWYILAANGTKITGDDRDAQVDADHRNVGQLQGKMFLDPADLVPGDVIRFETNGKGELTRGLVDFRINYATRTEVTVGSETVNYGLGFQYGYQKTLASIGNALYTSYYHMLLGRVEKVTDNGFTIGTVAGNPANGGAPATPVITQFSINNATCFEFNTRRETLSKISMGDLELGDEIAVFSSGDLSTIVTIRITDGRN